jgi:hypothetical protein
MATPSGWLRGVPCRSGEKALQMARPRTSGPGRAVVDPGLRPAVELAGAIRSRELSSVELLDHYLDRVDRLNPAINALPEGNLNG